MKQIRSCGISDTNEFHTLWRLPKFPLTELIGKYSPDFHGYDQELVISLPTGHVQLKYQFDPDILYNEAEYSYRTAISFKSTSGLIFFERFLKGLIEGRFFSSIIDVGGNDLALAHLLSPYGRSRTVIDPVCNLIDGQTIDGIKVIGKYIEQVDLSSDIERPDLVVCRHALEHIARPRDVVRQWFRQCRPDCLYVLEIPCFENLIEAQRFDAVFHQHYHYFDLASLKRLIWECGGEYLSHAYYHQGSCGGALLFAFRKAREPQPALPDEDLAARIRHIEKRIAKYTEQMQIMGELLEELPGPVYGYGAGLMLATLGYHLKTDFSKLVCILDDDPSKDGMTYRNVPVTVRSTEKMFPPPNSSFLITSMENVRPIFRKITDLLPRRVLLPFLS